MRDRGTGRAHKSMRRASFKMQSDNTRRSVAFVAARLVPVVLVLLDIGLAQRPQALLELAGLVPAKGIAHADESRIAPRPDKLGDIVDEVR
jgi:hypothetical protein